MEPKPRLRIGILGGGQLGRMLALAGYPLGLAFTLLDPKARVSGSKVCDHIQAGYDDVNAIEELINRSDVVTFEFENVPEESLERINDQIPVLPGAESLRVTGDRLTEKTFFQDLGLETADIVPVDSAEDLRDAADELGLPLVLKTRSMGYDGKGQALVEHWSQVGDAWFEVDEQPSIAEEMVDYERELSVIGVRAPDGSTRIYPIVENIHEDGVLVESRAPASFDDRDRAKAARSYCRKILEELDYVGVLALELFDTGDALLANEYAPRVHNSGHWTIEGAETSQFENHLRAVAGLPLGSTDAVGHSRMLNIIGEFPDRHELLADAAVHMHDYEKSGRPGRKIGHINLRADTANQADRLADDVRGLVTASRDLGT